MILKLIKYSLTMLLCCITLISCGQENISTNKPYIGKKENYSTGTPDIIENSSLPTQTPKKSKGRKHPGWFPVGFPCFLLCAGDSDILQPSVYGMDCPFIGK